IGEGERGDTDEPGERVERCARSEGGALLDRQEQQHRSCHHRDRVEPAADPRAPAAAAERDTGDEERHEGELEWEEDGRGPRVARRPGTPRSAVRRRGSVLTTGGRSPWRLRPGSDASSPVTARGGRR